MSDIRDYGAFVRGRWTWTKFGYEKGFPRGCQFTDIDAAVEFDGRSLVIETKAYDGTGPFPVLSRGQRLFLESLADESTTVLVLFGCGVCNDPYGVFDVGRNKHFDWTQLSKAERRLRLKRHIDRAMDLLDLEALMPEIDFAAPAADTQAAQ